MTLALDHHQHRLEVAPASPLVASRCVGSLSFHERQEHGIFLPKLQTSNTLHRTHDNRLMQDRSIGKRLMGAIPVN